MEERHLFGGYLADMIVCIVRQDSLFVLDGTLRAGAARCVPSPPAILNLDSLKTA